MTSSNILFIGMDVHKESIEIAIAEGAGQEVRRYGKIGGTHDAMRKTLRKLVSQGKTLHFCYEAGPCGYKLYRYLVSEGHDCWVVAPSMIPKKPGDKVKTDKRDAVQLARLFRAGELTPVYVPNREDEAIRDLSRAREDTMLVQKSTSQRLKSFLLRHDIRYQRLSQLDGAFSALVKLDDFGSVFENDHPSLLMYNHRISRHYRLLFFAECRQRLTDTCLLKDLLR